MTNNIDARTLRQLQLMANKLQDDHAYMAWVISVYQKEEKSSLYKLTKVLGTTAETLAKLALCKRPDTTSKDFRKQVSQISEYTKIDLLLLLKMIRQVESVITLSADVDSDRDLASNTARFDFVAARDRDEEPSEQDNTTETEDEDDVVDS